MRQGLRWMTTSAIGVGVAAAAWITCQWRFGLDAEVAATVAALAVALVGAPLAAWAARGDGAARGEPAEPAHRVSNLPARNPGFTGRAPLLRSIGTALRGDHAPSVVVLHGAGGIGKTTASVEFAHRHAGRYRIIWWIGAGRADLIAEQLAALALAAGWTRPTSDIPSGARATMANLRTSPDWLLVFDNAEAPEDIVPWLPGGPGHVLVTSRNPVWSQVARPLPVDVLSADESVTLLHRLAPEIDAADAHRVAAQVGYLPLAMVQAGSVLAETGMHPREYLDNLASRAGQTLSDGKPPDYPNDLNAAVRMSLDRLESEDPDGVRLLRICACLDARLIPTWMFMSTDEAAVPSPLDEFFASGFDLRRALGRLGRYGLIKVSQDGIAIHRIIGELVAQNIAEAQRPRVLRDAERLLITVKPPKYHDPLLWPAWAAYLPHLLALDPAASTDAELRAAAVEGARYIRHRGDLRACVEFSARLYERWRQTLGPDRPETIEIAQVLAVANGELGRHAASLDVLREVLDRHRALHGPDDLRTLRSATLVALAQHRVGMFEEARALASGTLARLESVHGRQHRLTLGVGHNLALHLRALGRKEEALELNETVFARRRRHLGEDDPDTLVSAYDVARDMFLAGRRTEAMTLATETLQRVRNRFGEDHPRTLRAEASVAEMLDAEGRRSEARKLREDVRRRGYRVFGSGETGLRASEDPVEIADFR